MCSECPYSGEKLMTALKKKHQFKGTLEDILDKETYNQCGQTSLRVAQGKFYESLCYIKCFVPLHIIYK